MFEIIIRNSTAADKDWIRKIFSEHWGALAVVSKGRLHHCDNLKGLMAIRPATDDMPIRGELHELHCGLLTYQIENSECQIVTLNSLIEKSGIASQLIKSIIEKAAHARCRRLWLTTTNDNINAIDFYGKRGFELIDIRKNVMAEYRKLKPEIPETGESGILITDELEFELRLIS